MNSKRIQSRLFLISSLAFVLTFLSVAPVYGFNSNLPPPWLAHSKPIYPISSRSHSKSNNNPNKKVSSSSEKPSSNSGSQASNDPETPRASVSKSGKEEPIEDEELNDPETKLSTERAPNVAGDDVSWGQTNKVPATMPSFGVQTAYVQSGSTAVPSATSLLKTQKKAVSPAVAPHLANLLKMCRLSNLPGVLLLHMMGTYAAIRSTSHSFVSTLLHPSMMLVFSTLIITSCSSMVVNDYYDARTGVDVLNSKPSLLAPAPVVKRFLTYLYTGLLTLLVVLPGKASRMSVVVGSLLTFWYTQHLKPKTWIKNVSCAGIIALSPFTSAAAACYTRNLSLSPMLGNIVRMCSMIFFGIMGREIWMDVLDEEGDRTVSIRTVPVVYGKRAACRIVLGLSLCMTLLSVSGPLLELWLSGGTATIWRRLGLSLIGSGMVVRRAIEIVAKDGMNLNLVKQAIEEDKLALVFLMGSFV